MKNRGLVENGEVRRKTFSHDCFLGNRSSDGTHGGVPQQAKGIPRIIKLHIEDVIVATSHASRGAGEEDKDF